MNTFLTEIWNIALGLIGLAFIVILFVGIYKLAGWVSPELALCVGLAYWVIVAIAWANEWARR